MDREVLVVVGVGGMGQVIARRLGAGRAVLLADFDENCLADTALKLGGGGYRVTVQRVDVASAESVSALAKAAAALGEVTGVVHTAGLSPAQAPAAAILKVDLLGVAHVLDEFGGVIAEGGAGVVIASMAGHQASPFTPEQEKALASTATNELLRLPFVDPDTIIDPGLAYVLAKRANHLRVQAASIAWGKRGARINSISPGIISTAMNQQELQSAAGDMIRAMIEASAVGRMGTPEEIAAVTAFLLGPDSSFITGTDLLVDGGVVAAGRSGHLDLNSGADDRG